MCNARSIHIQRFCRKRGRRQSDSITDFQHNQHDKIDLHSIDANVVSLDEAFHFIGAARFHQQAGELRYARHILQGDVDGDGTADFQIHVNAATLVRGDFVL